MSRIAAAPHLCSTAGFRRRLAYQCRTGKVQKIGNDRDNSGHTEVSSLDENALACAAAK